MKKFYILSFLFLVTTSLMAVPESHEPEEAAGSTSPGKKIATPSEQRKPLVSKLIDRMHKLLNTTDELVVNDNAIDHEVLGELTQIYTCLSKSPVKQRQRNRIEHLTAQVRSLQDSNKLLRSKAGKVAQKEEQLQQTIAQHQVVHTQSQQRLQAHLRNIRLLKLSLIPVGLASFFAGIAAHPQVQPVRNRVESMTKKLFSTCSKNRNAISCGGVCAGAFMGLFLAHWLGL